ncbi:hypothetical protein [Glycomyces harbinensis]|uniref:hypothetical protein n=1 Tax=Glycomyces harbinensis TaxID=58114 RepID=UPI00115F7D78|nr:hypothetical protein [Glycomyces harbinensis]
MTDAEPETTASGPTLFPDHLLGAIPPVPGGVAEELAGVAPPDAGGIGRGLGATRPDPRPPSDRSDPLRGPEMVAQALPFATVPSEPLREHFTKWLVRSLTQTAWKLGLAEAKAQQAEPARAAPETKPGPEPRQTREPSGPTATTKAAAERTAEPVNPPEGSVAKRRRKPPSAPRTKPRQAAPPPAPTHLRGPLTAPETPAASGGQSTSPRPQFVQRGDPTVWITNAFLRSRGWTGAAIRDFLPEPEGLKPNPRFAATGAPMPVWRPETVAAAEKTADWRAWLERSLRRRQTTLAALAASEDADFRVRLEIATQAIEACGGSANAGPTDRATGVEKGGE